jgi:hypothetical protein
VEAGIALGFSESTAAFVLRHSIAVLLPDIGFSSLVIHSSYGDPAASDMPSVAHQGTHVLFFTGDRLDVGAGILIQSMAGCAKCP